VTKRSSLPAVAAALLVGLGSGYGLARLVPPSEAPASSARKPLHYRHPMNPSVTSPTPAKDEMGMDYIPVYPESEPAKAPPGEREILYYRNPMGLPDTSPVPKKDAMGMDYVPVYADEEPEDGARLVKIGPDKVQKLGVRTVAAERRDLARTIRAVGLVEMDERRQHTVALRFDGYIEKLHVDATGQTVARGQPLFELYSPDLVAAQNEYLIARNSRAGPAGLAQSSLERLRYWGVADPEIRRLEEQGTVRRTLVIRSPAAGTVMEKKAVAGMKAGAGEELFRIADLSTVWVIAEVFEQDIGGIAVGRQVRVGFDAYPGRSFEGKIGFIYPTLRSETRTARVRIELPNPDGLLKPMMYAHVELAGTSRPALAIPESAVLAGGKRPRVLVERGAGRFEPRPVELGVRGDQGVEVLQGLREGEKVVDSANFLIDAESSLKSALDSFGEPAGGEK
jgi:Cu(I)/Ag(I) efflux system membrane fusion protein